MLHTAQLTQHGIKALFFAIIYSYIIYNFICAVPSCAHLALLSLLQGAVRGACCAVGLCGPHAEWTGATWFLSCKKQFLKLFSVLSAWVGNTSSQCNDNRWTLPGNPFKSWLGKLYQLLCGKVSVEIKFLEHSDISS